MTSLLVTVKNIPQWADAPSGPVADLMLNIHHWCFSHLVVIFKKIRISIQFLTERFSKLLTISRGFQDFELKPFLSIKISKIIILDN